MKKRIVTMVLVVVLVLGFAVVPAQAAEYVEGDCVACECYETPSPFDLGKITHG